MYLVLRGDAPRVCTLSCSPCPTLATWAGRAAYLVFLCSIIHGHDGMGPVGVRNGTDQTDSLLVFTAEKAEGFMVLGAEAFISDLPLDRLQLLGDFHHTAQLSVRPQTPVSGCLPTDRAREVPL